MKHRVWILVGALWLAQPALALNEPPASPAPDTHTEQLNSEFDAFIQQALKEGLLSPAGPGAAKAPPPEESHEPADLRPEPKRAPPLTDQAGELDCTQPYPLDFTRFSKLTRYGDLYQLRAAGTLPPEGEEQKTHPDVVRAYISLDLAPEAAMAVGRIPEGEGVALKQLARLLEGRGKTSSAFFAELAGCYPEAGLWHALSLLSEGDAQGAVLFPEHLADFRKLPLQLRDRAALIAITGLDALGERTLMQKILTAFSDDQIAESAQLTFSRAIVDLNLNAQGAEGVIEDFLIQSRFEEAALAVLIRHKRPVRDTVRAVLLDEMVTRIELAQKDADVRGDLRFVLNELGQQSQYVQMIRLAELPSLQSEAAREELVAQLAANLERDLAGEDRLRNLAAIEALLNDEGLLDTVPNRTELYAAAATAAIRLGFGSLGEALAAKDKGAEGLADQRTLLAYRQKQYEAVFQLADRHPGDARVQLIAAKAAMDTGATARLSTYESRIPLDPETTLTLIEHDAAGGRWMLSGKVYAAAAALTDPEQGERVSRVMRLRTASAPRDLNGQISIASIPGRLGQSRAALDQMNGEAP